MTSVKASGSRWRAGRLARSVGLALLVVSGGARTHADEPPVPLVRFSEAAKRYGEAAAKDDVKEQVRLLALLCDAAARPAVDPKDPGTFVAAEENRRTARAFCRKALTAREKDLILAGLKGYATLALGGSSADFRSYADIKLSEKRPQDVRLAAVAAWAAVHDPGTHALLLEYIRLPSREPDRQALAVEAARGLGQYRGLTKGAARYEMLRDYMQIFDAIYNSQILMASADASAWWGLLHPVMVESFNQITRASVSNHAAAVTWWRENRRKVQAGTD